MTSVRETGFINSQPSLAECFTLLPLEEEPVTRNREFAISTPSANLAQRDSNFREQKKSNCSLSRGPSVDKECSDYPQQPDKCAMHKHSSPPASYASRSNEPRDDYQPLNSFSSHCNISGPDAVSSAGGMVTGEQNSTPYSAANDRPFYEKHDQKVEVLSYQYTGQQYDVPRCLPMQLSLGAYGGSLLNCSGPIHHRHESDQPAQIPCEP